MEGAGGSRGAIYKAAGHLGVRAQGNRREISGELDAGGRCGRKGVALTRGPGRSAKAAGAGRWAGEGEPTRGLREGAGLSGARRGLGRWRAG